ncbi:MAG: sensor histidine kinase [Bacteroidetes bacterium]|nr:sensor histidine kinase [Bacteroidota bacterium]
MAHHPRLLLFFLLICAAATAQPVHDFRSVQFDQSHTYPVSGTWEFYWKQLLEPSQLDATAQRDSLRVPGSWNRQRGYSPLGYGTYRTRLHIPASSGLALYFPVINSAATFWVNGKKIATAGNVAASKDDYEAKLAATLVELPADVTEVEIVVQVANFTYFSGGIPEEPQLGKVTALLNDISKKNGVENFFAGSLIAMFIYQLILYFLFDRGKPYLWLSLICFGAAVRAMIVHGGSFLLPDLFPAVSWEIWKKIEFGAVYGTVAFFPLYIYHLFKDKAPRWPIVVFVSVATLLCAAGLFTPQNVYGQLLDVCHVALLLGFVYVIYVVSKSWREGSSDARIIFFGVLASFPFILIEILKNSVLVALDIQFMYLVELGVLVFLLFQVYLLANHYAKSYQSLETMNVQLEQQVLARTEELISTNRVKDRLLSVMSHDIKSPLNSLRGILSIYNKGKIEQSEFNYYFKRIEGDLSRTSLLVDNILYWKAAQLKGVKVSHENFDLHLLLKENVDLFQTIAFNKSVTIRVKQVEDKTIRFDRSILNLTLRNLLANAIKFSHKGGTIWIAYEEHDKHASIHVQDEGVGMTDEWIHQLEKPVGAKSSVGTAQEAGTGLGLSFCVEYLQMAGGNLKIKSKLNEGSTFTIEFPLLAV